jgi:hypothetical protein
MMTAEKNVAEKNVVEKNVVDVANGLGYPSYVPSERDADVYRLIVIAGLSTREVARQAKVSQTRVRQIVQRVMQWLAEVLPAEAEELSPDAALTVARHIAAERLELLYQHALHCWRESTHTKYASLAARLAVARSKLAVITSPSDRLAEAIELPDEDVGTVECDQTSAGGVSLHPQAPEKEAVVADGSGDPSYVEIGVVDGSGDPSYGDLGGLTYGARYPLDEDCSPRAADESVNSYIPFKTVSGEPTESIACETTFASQKPPQKTASGKSPAAIHPLLTPVEAPPNTPTNVLTDEDAEAILRRAFRRDQRRQRPRHTRARS